MSRDYYLGTVIGLRVRKEDLFDSKEVSKNTCTCTPQTEPQSEDDVYCHKCGRIIEWKRAIDVPKFGNLVVGNDSWKWKETTLCGWPVYAGTNPADYYYVGMLINESGNCGQLEGDGFTDLDDIAVAIDEAKINAFMVDMIGLGLWDGEKFGLWSVLKCSY
jgi:hypothetical protein